MGFHLLEGSIKRNFSLNTCSLCGQAIFLGLRFNCAGLSISHLFFVDDRNIFWKANLEQTKANHGIM